MARPHTVLDRPCAKRVGAERIEEHQKRAGRGGCHGPARCWTNSAPQKVSAHLRPLHIWSVYMYTSDLYVYGNPTSDLYVYGNLTSDLYVYGDSTLICMYMELQL